MTAATAGSGTTKPLTRSGGLLRGLVLGVILTLGNPPGAFSQNLKDVQAPGEPLVLKSRGSFMVGGDVVTLTAAQLWSTIGLLPDSGGPVIVNQMYVQFMVPATGRGVPVVMVHGAGLSGKTYETTPDGRMGWDEYFVRRGHPVYVPDQAARARSGVNIAGFNDVRAGVLPPSATPVVSRTAMDKAWLSFRFGPAAGVPFPDEQFPVAAAEQLAKQAVPNFNSTLPTPNPNYKALADLAVQLEGAVLMGHSQSGAFPLEAILTNAAGIRGAILIEPGSCGGSSHADAQIATLARVPILVVFGDHLDAKTGIPGGFSWRNSFENCKTFIARIQGARGNAQMLYPPDLGIRGNSHMIMQDRNNLQIADLLLKWIDANVGAAKRAAPRS